MILVVKDSADERGTLGVTCPSHRVVTHSGAHRINDWGSAALLPKYRTIPKMALAQLSKPRLLLTSADEAFVRRPRLYLYDSARKGEQLHPRRISSSKSTETTQDVVKVKDVTNGSRYPSPVYGGSIAYHGRFYVSTLVCPLWTSDPLHFKQGERIMKTVTMFSQGVFALCLLTVSLVFATSLLAEAQGIWTPGGGDECADYFDANVTDPFDPRYC